MKNLICAGATVTSIFVSAVSYAQSEESFSVGYWNLWFSAQGPIVGDSQFVPSQYYSGGVSDSWSEDDMIPNPNWACPHWGQLSGPDHQLSNFIESLTSASIDPSLGIIRIKSLEEVPQFDLGYCRARSGLSEPEVLFEFDEHDRYTKQRAVVCGRNGGIPTICFYYAQSKTCEEGLIFKPEAGECGIVDPPPSEPDENEEKDDECFGGVNPCTDNPCVGNPCNPATGSKLQREVDYDLANSNIDFIRYYSSRTKREEGLGIGWSSPHFKHLRVLSDRITIIEGTGRSEVVYIENGQFIPAVDSDYHLVFSGVEYALTNNKGVSDVYDADGKLQSVNYPNNQYLQYQYDGQGQLLSVQNQFGQSIQFTWVGSRVSTITDPYGQPYSYTYDPDGNLIQVGYPDANNREYLYEILEQPNHLTGIVDERGLRISTYEYDGAGKLTKTSGWGSFNSYRVKH